MLKWGFPETRCNFYLQDINIDFILVLSFFSRLYNPLWLYFHSPVTGFSLLVFEVSWSHKNTCHIRKESYGRVFNPSQRHLPDNTQNSQQINVSGGIRTRNLSRRTAEDLCLRTRGHCDRRFRTTVNRNYMDTSAMKTLKRWLEFLTALFLCNPKIYK